MGIGLKLGSCHGGMAFCCGRFGHNPTTLAFD
jgi:hypothetical protein